MCPHLRAARTVLPLLAFQHLNITMGVCCVCAWWQLVLQLRLYIARTAVVVAIAIVCFFAALTHPHTERDNEYCHSDTPAPVKDRSLDSVSCCLAVEWYSSSRLLQDRSLQHPLQDENLQFKCDAYLVDSSFSLPRWLVFWLRTPTALW